MHILLPTSPRNHGQLHIQSPKIIPNPLSPVRGLPTPARLIYTLLTKGQAYVDRGQSYYEELYQQRVVRNLQKRAAAMGFSLTPVEPVPA